MLEPYPEHMDHRIGNPLAGGVYAYTIDQCDPPSIQDSQASTIKQAALRFRYVARFPVRRVATSSAQSTA